MLWFPNISFAFKELFHNPGLMFEPAVGVDLFCSRLLGYGQTTIHQFIPNNCQLTFMLCNYLHMSIGVCGLCSDPAKSELSGGCLCC